MCCVLRVLIINEILQIHKFLDSGDEDMINI